jgi:hypothetical protein
MMSSMSSGGPHAPSYSSMGLLSKQPAAVAVVNSAYSQFLLDMASHGYTSLTLLSESQHSTIYKCKRNKNSISATANKKDIKDKEQKVTH